jgi:hypothetical protein
LGRRHGAGRVSLDQEWASELGISGRDVDAIFKGSAFGAAWCVIEDQTPLFARRSLRPTEQPEQITIARRSLSLLAGIRIREKDFECC